MTKKKFHIILAVAIIVDFVLSIIAGSQVYSSEMNVSDPSNVFSWFSLILPAIISYAVYRGLKYLFNQKLGLVVAIILMVLSLILLLTLPSFNQEAAAVIEALNFGLLVFAIGMFCIYKLLQKHFDNYQNLE